MSASWVWRVRSPFLDEDFFKKSRVFKKRGNYDSVPVVLVSKIIWTVDCSLTNLITDGIFVSFFFLNRGWYIVSVNFLCLMGLA